MRLKIKQLGPALAVATALIAVPAAGARAETTSSLPQLTGFHQMVVDSLVSPGYVFLSTGVNSQSLVDGATSTGPIIVTDLAGNYVATVDNGDGAEGLALSPDGKTLYAALAANHAVTAIDVSTITQATPAQTQYQLGSGEVPVDLAMQSGRLWVSYNTSPTGAGGAVGDIDISGTSPAFTPDSLPQPSPSWYSAPQIAGDPDNTGILVAAIPVTSPTEAASYGVTGTSATIRAQATELKNSSGGDTCDNLGDLAVVPGGAQFIPACGYPYVHNVYSTTDLSLQSSYPTSSYPDATAIAENGTVAAGIAHTYDPSIYVFHSGGTSPLNTFRFSSSANLVSRGLAWSADASKLYAVVQNGDNSYSLHVYSDPTLTQSTLTLSGPATASSGQGVTLKGSFSLASGTAPGATSITVTRTAAGGAVTTLPPVTTAADGSFTITNTPPATGTYTYTVSYAGDSTTAPATASYAVTVSLIGSRLSLSGPSHAVHGRPYTLSGTLTLGTGNPSAGTPIAITRTKPGTHTMHWTVKTASNGGFSLTTKPPALGTYTYTATYAGSTTTKGATATRKVRITKLPVSLRITASKSSMAYDGTVKVTAHLGKTHSNRTVSIYARTVGSDKRILIKHGRVNSSGNLTVRRREPHSTVFSAVFGGDARYQAKTVTRTVGVRARVATRYTSYYATKRAGGIRFHLYHHTATLHVAIAVTPNKHGQCVRLQMQEFYNHSWRNARTGCGHLNSHSKIKGYLALGHADRGYAYRIRVDYQRKSSDQSNLNARSSWFYFVVMK